MTISPLEDAMGLRFFWKYYKRSLCKVWGTLGMLGLLINGLLILIAAAIDYSIYKSVFGFFVDEISVWAWVFWTAILVMPIIAFFNLFREAALEEEKLIREEKLRNYGENLIISHYISPDTKQDITQRMAKSSYATIDIHKSMLIWLHDMATEKTNPGATS